MSDWRTWLREREGQSTMTAERIPLRDVQGWELSGDAIRRTGSSPYEVIGIRVRGAERTPNAWDQPMIAREGSGFIVLPWDPEEQAFLFAAKAEPGNGRRPGCVVITAPLQSSQWNLEARHGGQRPPRAELYDAVLAREIKWMDIPQDPGMLFAKVNRFAVLPTRAVDVPAIAPRERWFTRREVREALAEGHLSEHLMQAIAIALLP